MAEIILWAPLASRADAHLDTGEVRPLTRRDAEHFAVELPAGTRYKLAIDGGPGLPDPRSRRQPEGVHGPSEVVDLTTLKWSDAAWPGLDVRGRVIYELHVGTFTPEGTLDAAIERLDHLVALGVEVVELMPLASFPGTRGWGYDGVDLFAVHEPYGGIAALARFVDAAHARGLAVALDCVYNHFGPDGNYAPAFAPYLSSRHAGPWGDGINLDDAHSRGVRQFIIDNALSWLRDLHLDALRLDAVHALQDASSRHILAELADAVAQLSREVGRPLSLIAESDLNDARMITPTVDGGFGMSAQWDDDVHHALHSYLTGETFGYYVDFGSAEVLEHALTRVFVHDGAFSTFRGRDWGAPVDATVDRRRFVVFSENHDQVGNRALGDRPGSRHGPAVAAAAAAIILLGPYTPMLFQGQEWGSSAPFMFFTNHSDDLGHAVTQGRRTEFGCHGWESLYGPDLQVPDPQDERTWRASLLDWDEASEEPYASLLAWHRDLIALRREVLAPGEIDPDAASGRGGSVTCAHGEGWFAMTHGRLTVALSVGPRVVDLDAVVTVADAVGDLVATWGSAELTEHGLRLGPQSVAVLLTR